MMNDDRRGEREQAGDSRPPAPGANIGPLRIAVQDWDAHPRLWAFAGAGLVVAGALAQWGLPPVDLHGPLHHMGVMDPLCGGTRALQAMARGRLGRAWAFNPAGVVLFCGAWAELARVGIGRLAGRWLRVSRRPGPWFWVFLAVSVAVLEVNQQLHARLLMR